MNSCQLHVQGKPDHYLDIVVNLNIYPVHARLVMLL